MTVDRYRSLAIAVMLVVVGKLLLTLARHMLGGSP
jgi:hypothetical protein